MTEVLLAAPYTRDGADPAQYRHLEPVERGPVVGRTRGSTRWHRIRSAVRFTAAHPVQRSTTGWPRTVVSWWCGGAGGAIDEPESHRYVITADAPPDGEPLCGTCAGRAIGAGWPPVAVAVETPLLFSPFSSYRIPTICPAVKLRLVPDDAGRAFPCPACDVTTIWRTYCRGYGDVSVCVESHEPSDGLVAPCPFHAWDQLVVGRDGRALCRCRTDPHHRGAPTPDQESA